MESHHLNLNISTLCGPCINSLFIPCCRNKADLLSDIINYLYFFDILLTHSHTNVFLVYLASFSQSVHFSGYPWCFCVKSSCCLILEWLWNINIHLIIWFSRLKNNMYECLPTFISVCHMYARWLWRQEWAVISLVTGDTDIVSSHKAARNWITSS